MTIIRHDFQRSKQSSDSKEKEKIPGFQLRIELSYSSPPIWRTVNVPGTFTLSELHTIIQHCFGWRDDATYRFLVGKIFYSPDEISTISGSRPSSAIQLHELEKDMGFIFSYLYDGGCGWECEITLEHLFPDTQEVPHPCLIEANGACPPSVIEDIHEYQEMLTNLEKADINREEILANSGVSPSFDPEFCDIAAINNLIKEIV